MNTIIVGGWILLVGTVSGGITVVPTQYKTEDECKQAAIHARQNIPAGVGWTCLEAGKP